jgi:flagellar basal body P-ring formation protein FlgA
MPRGVAGPRELPEAIACMRERETDHASGQGLPLGQGTTGRTPVVASMQVTAVELVTQIGAALASYPGTMKRTTKSRRNAWLGSVTLLFVLSTQAQEDPNVEPLASIRNTAQTYVKSLIPASAGETTVTVGQLDSRLRLAHCPPKEISAALPAGMTLQARATVGVSCAGPVHWTVFVPVTIESKIDVLVLTHAVNRDARLTAADVTVETRKTSGPGNAYLAKLEELGGRTVRRPLAAGTTLSVDMFTPDLIVRRGQEVTLLSSGGTVEVRAYGRAMVDGAAGSRIQVQNLSSQRVVEGVVESADRVRVAW